MSWEPAPPYLLAIPRRDHEHLPRFTAVDDVIGGELNGLVSPELTLGCEPEHHLLNPVDDLDNRIDFVSAEPDPSPFPVVVLFGHHGYLPLSLISEETPLSGAGFAPDSGVYSGDRASNSRLSPHFPGRSRPIYSLLLL